MDTQSFALPSALLELRKGAAPIQDCPIESGGSRFCSRKSLLAIASICHQRGQPFALHAIIRVITFSRTVQSAAPGQRFWPGEVSCKVRTKNLQQANQRRVDMSAQKRKHSVKGDPVAPGQGGRVMPVDPGHPLHLPRKELVRRKAYELYERRGKTDGHAIEDWLQAERHTQL